MFTVKIDSDNILVTLPKVIRFNKIFHEEICRLFYVVNNNKNSDNLIIHAKDLVQCDKMCKAMLCNVMSYISDNHVKKVYVDRDFNEKILSQVRARNIELYAHKDIIDWVINPSITYYAMKEQDDPSLYVEDLVQKIVDTSLCYSRGELKDLLVSTIGEIIANCRNHSKQDTAYIMHQFYYDKNQNFLYLHVNVIDYGETIVESVRNFFQQPRIRVRTCMSWAREWGHSTKEGSGGYGIPQMVDYLKAVKGSVSIYSGSGVFTLDEDGTEKFAKLEKGDFKGTSVSFSVKLFGMEDVLVVENKTFKSVRAVSLKDLI